MVEHYKLERPLIINEASEKPIPVEAGNYILTEATGELSFCEEEDLQANVARIEADIVVRDAQIEADRLAEEQRLAEEAANRTEDSTQ